MKKLYSLIALGALVAMPAFAQEEEDVTHYITNPGFDLDLTFQTDGSTKELVDESGTLSGRSYKWLSEDGTIYAGTIREGNGNWKRTDDPHMCVNGFLGQIKGWTLATGSNGEWTYFGAIPYAVGETAIGIADDNNGSWLTMPAKPEADSGEDNVASMYLRAGWTNYAAYSQTVSLPCAQYRLEYWINNLNFAATDASGLENLCKITCRDDVFPDSTGVNADGWEKHTILFTPTADFTIQMGFKAGNYGSGKNPILLIDGMKLYKIGEADQEELLRADLNNYVEKLYAIASDSLADYPGLGKYVMEQADEFAASEDDGPEAMVEATKAAKAYIEVANTYLAKAEAFVAQIDEAFDLLAETAYPGADDFMKVLSELKEYADEGLPAPEGEDAIEYLEQQELALKIATAQYQASQEASEDNPADYSFLVDNPTFAEQGAWYIGQTGGDQRLATDKTDNEGNPINCWNAWRNNLTDASQSVSISQDLTALPIGYYKLVADMNTQDGCITDQHIFANGSASVAESPVMTITGWDPCQWETLETGKVLVVDGKLTIGAIGHGDTDLPTAHGGTDTDARRGWFNLSNVKLLYLGKATDDEIAAAIAARYEYAEAHAADIKYAADKAAYTEAVAAAKEAADLDALNAAIAEADASILDYTAVTTGTLKQLQDSIAAYPGSASSKITEPVVAITNNYIGSAEATYTETSKYTTILRYYLNTVTPAIDAALKEVPTHSEKGQAVITTTVDGIVAELSAIKELPTQAELDEQLAQLKKALALAAISDIEVADGADVTAYIANPSIDTETGWTFNRPKGDKNSTTSQGVDGNASNRYLDCWQSAAGTTRYTAYQVLNVPNGKYSLANIMRTSGAGAYLFASDKAPVTNDEEALTLDPTATNVLAQAVAVPTPNAKYGIATEDGAEETVYTDSYGQIWMGAADRVIAAMGITPVEGATIYDLALDLNGGEETCPANVDPADWDIIKANTGKGRGWFNNSLEIEVTNHTLVLGVSCDSVFTAPAQGAAFEGTWFSADNFKLTLVKVGDNTGWDPTSGVATIEAALPAKAQAIYSISGARVAGLQKGINIVKMSDGAVKKVLVK